MHTPSQGWQSEMLLFSDPKPKDLLEVTTTGRMDLPRLYMHLWLLHMYAYTNTQSFFTWQSCRPPSNHQIHAMFSSWLAHLSWKSSGRHLQWWGTKSTCESPWTWYSQMGHPSNPIRIGMIDTKVLSPQKHLEQKNLRGQHGCKMQKGP